jgi:sulfide:quinone oxidoreductase
VPSSSNRRGASDRGRGFRVLIAGGGVAALEGLLALRELAGDRIAPVLFAPDPEFRYRPLSVTEPFGLAIPRRLDLAEFALEHDATFMRDALGEVDATNRRVVTGSGRELEYDALLVAIGAQGTDAVPGALTFRDSTDRGAFRGVLEELRTGAVHRLAFAVPSGGSWPLGLYELALLTAAQVRDQGLSDVELTLVTPEARPLEIFGRRASEAVGQLLDDAGVKLRVGSHPRRFENGLLSVDGGEPIACERAISLPAPEVAPIPGLPQQRGGFVAVDRFGGVLGVDRVFAAGDATWFPVKQGGLAAQLADCAASAIAALAGAPVDPQIFQPVLRGALLTEWGPRYMRSRLDDAAGEAAAKSGLWWPPAKVAGRYLAPYLAAKAGYKAPQRPLEDLAAPIGDLATDIEGGHEDAVAMALSSASASAEARDFRGALRWLEVAEDLDLYLPSEYELNRISWRELERQR